MHKKHKRNVFIKAALILVLLFAVPAFADDNAGGRMTGVWAPPAIGPIPGGLIYAFSVSAGPEPQRDRPLRSPNAVAVTDQQGRFTLELAEGSYFLATRKSQAGSPGPPQEGDLYGLIRDQKGALVKYTVKRGVTSDIGVLQQATVFKARVIKLSEGMTAITGVVKTGDGSPVADVVVLVYDNDSLKRKPDYISYKTGKDGKYVVKVEREGTYFLTARGADNRGSRPQTGDLFGVYGGETPQPVSVRKQSVTKGIDIQVGRYVDPKLQAPPGIQP